MNVRTSFSIRYATQKDYEVISRMIEYSNKNIKDEIGYPDCENLSELLSELELYRNTLEESICLIEYKNIPIALGGFLYTPGESEGYLIGLICAEEYCNKENIKVIIELILNSKKKIFTKVDAVISKNNTL